jgi:hypothetical protein
MRAAIPLAALLLLSACHVPPAQQPAAALPRQSADGAVAEALAHSTRLRRLPALELQHEQEVARCGLIKAADDRVRMRHELALALPGAGAAPERGPGGGIAAQTRCAAGTGTKTRRQRSRAAIQTVMP